jgi:hypothetical protein
VTVIPQGSCGNMVAVATLTHPIRMNKDAPTSPLRFNRLAPWKNCNSPIPNRISRTAKIACRTSRNNLFGEPGANSSLMVSEMWLYPGRIAPPNMVRNTNHPGATIPQINKIRRFIVSPNDLSFEKFLMSDEHSTLHYKYLHPVLIHILQWGWLVFTYHRLIGQVHWNIFSSHGFSIRQYMRDAGITMDFR